MTTTSGEQHVRTYLTQAIQAGSFPPGARLPAERNLCEILSVSRSAVRNALALLEGEGRITRVPGSGTYVREAAHPPHDGAAPLASPAQVMDARLAIEPPMADLIVANATAADFETMSRCIAAGAAASTFESFEHWDAALHEAIAAATRNPLVVEAYRLVTRARDTAEWGALKRRSLSDENRARYQSDHERIVLALRERDADAAARELRSHLVTIRMNLLGR
jgi:DNA-binding FadR family transcriptional regulator